MKLKKKSKIVIMILAIMIAVTGILPATGFADKANAATTASLAPTNIKAKDAKGYDTVTVSWSAVPDAAGYTVYMSKSKNTGFEKIKKTTSTSCTIDGITTGSKRYFKVETILNSEIKDGTLVGTDSTDSATDQVDGTGATEGTPTESEVVSATPIVDATNGSMYLNTGTKGTVKWTKVSGASGYLVYKKSGSTWKGVKNVKGGNSLKLANTKLTKKATNTYKIIPYRTVSGSKVKGYTETTSIYVPKVLKTSTKTYSKTNQAKIIKKARTKLGSRYVWGAAGPNKFDCSGFTYWVMKNARVGGTKIKRTSSQNIYRSYKKYSVGRSLSNAQPGDILLFGYGRSKSRIFHVGIYYGNGKYIHATTGGRGVTISSVPTGSLVSILRMPGLK